MNRTLIRGVLAVAVWIGLWKGGGDVAWGLTIYRIGGAELPPPELTQEEGVTFVQINWADVDGKTHGDIDQLDFESGYITPVQLDSTVNLTPLLEERGGQILALDWTGWGDTPRKILPFSTATRLPFIWVTVTSHLTVLLRKTTSSILGAGSSSNG